MTAAMLCTVTAAETFAEERAATLAGYDADLVDVLKKKAAATWLVACFGI